MVALAAVTELASSGALIDFLTQIPGLSMLDPKIEALRAVTDPIVLSNAVGAGLAELQTLLQTMKLDPRFKPQDLA